MNLLDKYQIFKDYNIVHFPPLGNYAIISLSNRTLGWVVNEICRMAFQIDLGSSIYKFQVKPRLCLYSLYFCCINYCL